MAAFLASRSGLSGILEARTLYRVIDEREQLASTAIGDGLAIPHGKVAGLHRLVGVLGRSQAGLAFDALDGKPTYLVFMLAAPIDSAIEHLNALARLSRLFRDPALRERLLAAPDGDTMYRTIAEEDAKL
jgi:PTS system nitrogen regulatory IIA component